MVQKNEQKNESNYCCLQCDYNTYKKYDYERHLLTSKHQNGTKMVQKTKKKTKKPNSAKKENYECICGNVYKYSSGYYRHKSVCDNVNKEECENECIIEAQLQDNLANNYDLKQIVLDIVKSNHELQKQNVELQKQVLDICKNIQPSINNHTIHNNCNNKTFNLQVFLNETCKDAMNISEFIENISLQLSDLENMGKLGYVDGISNIIIQNLNALDVTQRPMHCTDKKREIVYVKDDDEWQKEQDDKKRIKQVISSIVSKNLQLLPEYENKYPDYMNPESKKSDEYNKIIMETMGGAINNNGVKNKEKIIRKITKEVTIEKE